MPDMKEEHIKEAEKCTKGEFEYETISSSYGSEMS
jgi:hypothetical protein